MADPAWPFGGVSADRFYLGIDLDQTDIGTGYFIGMYCAVHGFVQSMKILSEMHNKNKKKDAPSVFFNDHN